MKALSHRRASPVSPEASFAQRKPRIWRLLLFLGGLAIISSLAFRLAPWLKERQLARLAVPELARRAELAPRDAVVLYYYGEALLATGAPDRAAEVFRQGVEAEPSAAPCYTGLAKSQAALGQPVAAETIFRQALRLAPREAETHFLLARLYFDHGRFVDAVPPMEAAARLQPRNARYWYLLGQTYARAFKRDEALEALQRAVKLDGRQPDYWRDLGRAFWDYSRLEEAEPCFKKALEFRPDDPVLLIWLGQVYLQKPETPENVRLAEEAFRRSIQIAPEMGEARLKLGELLSRAGRHEEAEKELRQAIRLSPALHQALFQLGQVLMRLGREREGKRYLNASDEMVSAQNTMETLKDQLDHQPLRAELRLRLARLYRRYGNLAGALHEYRQYASSRPADEQAKRELQQVNRALQEEAASAPSPAPSGSAVLPIKP